jgi:phage recombination protein Bet
MTDIARRGELTLSMLVDMTGYQAPEIALISRTVAVGAPLQELAVFLHACRTLQLDPLLRQAYWIRRKDGTGVLKGTLQVAIDGFRGLADRQGNYAGSSEPVFRSYQELKVGGKASLTVPAYCQVTTWKIVAGHKAAFTGEARWDEFYPGDGPVGQMWRRMPHHMLAKCAEAQSLRKRMAPCSAPSTSTPAPRGVRRGAAHGGGTDRQRGPAAPRRALTAEDYDRIYGSEEDADGPPMQSQGHPEPDPE